MEASCRRGGGVLVDGLVAVMVGAVEVADMVEITSSSLPLQDTTVESNWHKSVVGKGPDLTRLACFAALVRGRQECQNRKRAIQADSCRIPPHGHFDAGTRGKPVSAGFYTPSTL